MREIIPSLASQGLTGVQRRPNPGAAALSQPRGYFLANRTLPEISTFR
jgi:hypothetical protein